MKVMIEKEAENFLEKEGFNVVKRKTVKNKEDLKRASSFVGFPIAMKISSKKIVHKARVKGVIVNIHGLKAAEKAFSRLKKIKDFEEVLIQKMIMGQFLIIGLKKTPEFGLAIMVGAGGGNVERMRDISFRICPINEKDAEEMIKEIRFYKRLKEKHVNLKMIKKNLLKISNLAKKYPSIDELDINPLIVNEKEAVIVDARIVM